MEGFVFAQGTLKSKALLCKLVAVRRRCCSTSVQHNAVVPDPQAREPLSPDGREIAKTALDFRCVKIIGETSIQCRKPTKAFGELVCLRSRFNCFPWLTSTVEICLSRGPSDTCDMICPWLRFDDMICSLRTGRKCVTRTWLTPGDAPNSFLILRY